MKGVTIEQGRLFSKVYYMNLLPKQHIYKEPGIAFYHSFFTSKHNNAIASLLMFFPMGKPISAKLF